MGSAARPGRQRRRRMVWNVRRSLVVRDGGRRWHVMASGVGTRATAVGREVVGGRVMSQVLATTLVVLTQLLPVRPALVPARRRHGRLLFGVTQTVVNLGRRRSHLLLHLQQVVVLVIIITAAAAARIGGRAAAAAARIGRARGWRHRHRHGHHGRWQKRHGWRGRRWWRASNADSSMQIQASTKTEELVLRRACPLGSMSSTLFTHAQVAAARGVLVVAGCCMVLQTLLAKWTRCIFC